MTTATQTVALLAIPRINREHARCLAGKGYDTLEELSQLSEVEAVRILAQCPKRPDQHSVKSVTQHADDFLALRDAIEAEYPEFRFAGGKKTRGSLKLLF